MCLLDARSTALSGLKRVWLAQHWVLPLEKKTLVPQGGAAVDLQRVGPPHARDHSFVLRSTCFAAVSLGHLRTCADWGPKKEHCCREDGDEVAEGSSGHGHQLGDTPPQLVPEAQDETWQQHAGRAEYPACAPNSHA